MQRELLQIPVVPLGQFEARDGLTVSVANTPEISPAWTEIQVRIPFSFVWIYWLEKKILKELFKEEFEQHTQSLERKLALQKAKRDAEAASADSE
jgi:hypothetical protein